MPDAYQYTFRSQSGKNVPNPAASWKNVFQNNILGLANIQSNTYNKTKSLLENKYNEGAMSDPEFFLRNKSGQNFLEFSNTMKARKANAIKKARNDVVGWGIKTYGSMKEFQRAYNQPRVSNTRYLDFDKSKPNNISAMLFHKNANPDARLDLKAFVDAQISARASVYLEAETNKLVEAVLASENSKGVPSLPDSGIKIDPSLLRDKSVPATQAPSSGDYLWSASNYSAPSTKLAKVTSTRVGINL